MVRTMNELRCELQQRRTMASEAPVFTRVPRYTGDTERGEVSGHPGLYCLARLEYDDRSDAPWENGDYHGTPVLRDRWQGHDEHAGMVRLASTRDGTWFYPFADALATARKELIKFAPKAGKAWIEDAALNNVRQEVDYFGRWLRDDWCYVGVVVTLMREEPDGDDVELDSTSLWGIESDAHDYHVETANDLASELLHNYMMRNRFTLATTLHTEG